MRVKTNTITINGRTYDATTGEVIGGSAVVAPTKATKPAQVSDKRATIAHKIPVTDQSSKPPTPRIDRTTQKQSEANSHAKRHIERSQTLMRHIVKKPSTTKPTHAVAGSTSQPDRIVIKNGKAQKREERAKILSKSKHVSKFASQGAVKRVTAHVPVAAAPVARTNRNYDISNTPPTPIVIPDDKPLRELHKDLFETAIQNATSHTAKKHPIRRKHRKASRLTISAASLLLLVGFFVHQNAPNIALKRASSTIGFTAGVPSYQPGGFRRGAVEYEPGKVTIDFRSNSDTRGYTITQLSSDITDQAIQTRFLKGQSYQAIAHNGQTSYLYGSDNLTWVRNGIWYTIEGDSSLSKDQLLNIASSLL